MAYQARESATATINITYGHDDTHVIMQFSQDVNNNRMTEKQTRDMIQALENSLARLAAHQKKNKKVGSH